MERDRDPELSKELDRMNSEMKLEDELALASSRFEIAEILDEAHQNGEYGRGFEDGFRKGFLFYSEKSAARQRSIHDKHNALMKRWGLDNLITRGGDKL